MARDGYEEAWIEDLNDGSLSGPRNRSEQDRGTSVSSASYSSEEGLTGEFNGSSSNVYTSA